MPSPKLKPLSDQIMVITGATSGIGLVTARMAAKEGARLVLAARSEDSLKQLVEEINQGGGQAEYVVADVSIEDDVKAIARKAVESFGGFDTWVNNAGAFIYGKTVEVPLEDMKKLIDINFWGLVYGSLAAVEHLKEKGGALINIGSVLSDQAMILQGIYSASKHAVKGFTDALRMELDADETPISVTLIKPSAINTPYPEHAKNFMDEDAQIPPPVYAPETVARAILHSAAIPTPEVFIGSAGPMIAGMGRFAPRLTDKVMEKIMVPLSKKDAPAGPLEDNSLDQGRGSLKERGNYQGYTQEMSLYTTAALNPMATAAVVGGLAVLIAAWRMSRKTLVEKAKDRLMSSLN